MKLPSLKSIINLALFTLNCQASLVKAEHVLPVFSGYWYEETRFKYITSCLTPVYDYAYVQKDSVEKVAENFLANLPAYPNCKWGKVRLAKMNTIPQDFHFSNEDFKKIFTNANAIVPVEATRSCVNKDGIELQQIGLTLQPAYVCPHGSKRVFNQADQSFSCTTTTITNCGSDVVGRDLSVKGADLLGQVGLITIGASVIEVLSNPMVAASGIYLTPSDSFKHVPGNPFWGEKYGLLEEKDLSDKDDRKIYDAAIRQMDYDLNYTLGWDFHAGGHDESQIYDYKMQQWQTIYAPKKAKFRNDSFIYYAYLEGANLSILPEIAFPFAPKDIFKAFLSCRDKQGTLCSTGTGMRPVYGISHSLKPAWLMNAVFSAPLFSIQQADYAVQQYIKSPDIPRSVKVKELWALALKFQNDETKFNYLVDCLALLKPLELTSQLIQHFQAERNSQNQLRLFFALTEMLENQRPSTLSHDQLLNIIKIQHFVEDLLKTSTDKDILRHAIRGYAAIFPPEKAEYDIAKALARKDITHLQPLFSEKEKMFIDLDLAFATSKQQQKKLSQLMKTQFNEYQQAMFNHALCFTLNDFKPKWIDDNVREVLKQFLLKNQSSLFSITNAILPQLYALQPQFKDLPPCNWLNAYTTVMAHNQIEKDQFTLDYIRNEKNMFVQAALLAQLNWDQMSYIPDKEISDYSIKFESALKTMKLSNIQRTTLMFGLSSINTN